MSSFSEWDREGYRRRVGEEEAARRRRSIMAEQWGYQLAEVGREAGVVCRRQAYVPVFFDQLLTGNSVPGRPAVWAGRCRVRSAMPTDRICTVEPTR